MSDLSYRSQQRRLVGHGALLMLIGCVMGWGFLFFLMGEVSLWPFPGRWDYQLPGIYDAWRMAHMEGIVNGMLLWLAAAILPVLSLSEKHTRWLGYGLLATTWSIVVAACFDPLFEDGRGLAMGEALANNIAFLLFYIGVPLSMVVLVVVAVKCFRPDPARGKDEAGG